MSRLRLGLVLDREHHEGGRWVSALTPRLIDRVLRDFDCVWMEDQRAYEDHLGSVDVVWSMEPGWAAPRLDFLRTPAVRDKLSDVPAYVAFSDPHANGWREAYFLENGLDYVLGYYWQPTLHHFSRLPRNRLVHFPWAVPDEWIPTGPLRLRAQEKIAVFGAGRGAAYATRNWCRTFPFVESTDNSGVENKVFTDADYARWLASKDAAVAAGSTDPVYRMTLPKYFEIAGAGALLFAQETGDLERLGFRHLENCLIFDERDFEALARDYLAHPEDFLGIRERGRELVRRHHSLSVRLREISRHMAESVEHKSRGERRVIWLGEATGVRQAAGAGVPRSPAPFEPAPPTRADCAREAESSKTGPRVLLVPDVPGWAHDFKASAIAGHLAGEFDVRKRFQDDLSEADCDEADLIVFFYWMQTDAVARLREVLDRNRQKIVMGVSSHAELEGRMREAGIAALRRYGRAVFVNNRALLEELVPLLDVPVFYTPNGVDTRFFTPAGSNRSGVPMRVGWAGSLSNFGRELRGYDDFVVSAVGSLDDAELVTAARETEWRSREDMLEFYRSLDVYLCASRSEGTPNPCLEAAACGVPIVTTPVGNMPELIRDGESGLLVDRDVKDIAEALRLLRDNAALRGQLGQVARQNVESWDWRHQAENYRFLFRSVLSTRSSLDQVRFFSPSQVYVASADRMDRVLANLSRLADDHVDRVDTYATVIGGLSGLNYLVQIRPRRLVFYDINLAALDHARMIVELIELTRDPDAFVERVFSRRLGSFLAERGFERLDETSQQAWLERPVDETLLEETLASLSPRSRRTFERHVVPLISGPVSDGVRNCRRLLPCWPVDRWVPVGGGESSGVDESGRRVPNTNTFHYGHGWLASRESFDRVRRTLREAEVRFVPFDLLAQDLRCLGRFSESMVLHVSNIDDWCEDGWADRVQAWQLEAMMEQGELTVITSHNGIHVDRPDPHTRAFLGIAPYLYGRIVEVTHRTPWGFHEIARDNVSVDDYVSGSHPAETTILHVLVGEGRSRGTLAAAYRKALAQSTRVLVLEHDRDSADWSDSPERARYMSVTELEDLLDFADPEGTGARKTRLSLAGETDRRRNVLLVIDVARPFPAASAPLPGPSASLSRFPSPEPG